MSGDLAQWLEANGLGGHAASFASQGVDWDVLGDLTEPDLKELGLSLGDRKRLMKALAALNGSAAVTILPPALRPEPPPPSVDGERRQITVMFIDLIDSSPLTERFDPEVMRQVLGQFHQACVTAIEAHEGHIAQYSGDGLLVYFGYPQAHEDDAVRAVSAGLGVIANLRETNERLEAEHQVRLNVRLGIETGLVVAGEVGAGSARDSRAIVGETPIIASRLQTLAPPDSVVVGPATERLIQGSFLLEHMGARPLKGVKEPIEVYRVLSPTEADDSFEIRAVRGLTPLIGRTAELEMLRQRWKQSCDGEMRCVLLMGEPGIGKSRTLRAFRESGLDEDHEIIAFHCSSYHRDSPFWPVLQRLQRAFGLDAKTFTDADVDRLETALEDFGGDTAEAAVVLANLFGMPTLGRYPATDTASPTFKRRSLNVLVAMTEAMARRSPTLLMVEDAHWIDPSTLEFVRLVLERLTTARLLVLMTARPEFKPDWNYPHLVQLNLDRLSRRDRFEMIDRLTGDKPIPAVVVDHIVAKTDGVPLFVEELTKAVLQGGLLRDVGGRYELAGAAAITVPDTLQGSLLSRLDRLEPAVKEIAQVAATIGREFDRKLLGLISSRADADLQVILARLIAEDIILPAPGSAQDDGAYLFRHALIQEIAYQSLLLARRRRYHGLIADALEGHYPEIVDRQPEQVAQNLTASDSPSRAIDYWRRAGERALARAAYDEAMAHARRGLDLIKELGLGDGDRAVQNLPLLLSLAEAQHRSGMLQSLDAFQEAANIARATNSPSYFAQAALGFDLTATYLHDSGTAGIDLLEEAVVLIGPEETVERSLLLGRFAGTLHITGSFARAGEMAREAALIARRLNNSSALLEALNCELMQIGARSLPAADFASRREVLRELTDLSADPGEDTQRTGATCARCLTGYLEIGDFAGFETVMRHFQTILSSGPEAVLKWIEVGAQSMRGILVGDFALAERKAQESYDLAETFDAKFSSGVYGMQMFTIRREQGRLAQVAPLLKRFVDEHPEDETWRPGLMLIASDLGYEVQARRTFETMAELGFELPMDSKRLVTLTYLAEVAARIGEPDHVARIYAQLLPFADQAVTVPTFTLCSGSTARYLGALAGALGDWSAAEAHFEHALHMNEGMNAWPWLAHTQHELAGMLVARNRKGDRARAANLLTNASAAASRMGMFALEERIRGAAIGSKARN